MADGEITTVPGMMPGQNAPISDPPPVVAPPPGTVLPVSDAPHAPLNPDPTPEPVTRPWDEQNPPTQAPNTPDLPSDEANDERGAPREGQPVSEPVKSAFAPHRWGGDSGESAPDNTFYAATPNTAEASSVIPDSAPNGWLRDTDGGLWDVHSINGLAIEAGGDNRYHVKAHTPSGLKTLSSHTQERERAERHLEHIALHISEARGLIEFIQDDAEEAAEEIVAQKRSRRVKDAEKDAGST